ncbi:MAG TPA: ABC transporter permease [Ktedonobacterales bacterium]|nr:ABC transporter permease [Ktedonobacterales bacterium]
MHPRIIRAIARKDALDLLLNKQTLFMLLTPIIMALLFLFLGNILSGSTTEMLVYDPGYQPSQPVGVEQVLKGAFSNAHITQASSAQEVADAFGANGTQKKSSYAVGLVVPAGFEASLKAGERPTLQLYINGDDVNNQQNQLLQSALADYSRAVISPAPIALSTSTINPPASKSVGDALAGFYALTALLSSFFIGMAVAPGLIIEEKEKKTLRMLMVSPASWADVITAKLLVALVYQLVLALVVLGIVKGFTGQIPLVLLFALLGSLFSVSLGALAGSIFKTQAASGAFSGLGVFIFITPLFFSDLLGLGGNNPFAQVIKVLPAYWLGDGVIKALENRATLESVLLDVVIVVGSTLLLFLISVWGLRRQASVVSEI